MRKIYNAVITQTIATNVFIYADSKEDAKDKADALIEVGDFRGSVNPNIEAETELYQVYEVDDKEMDDEIEGYAGENMLIISEIKD